MQAIRTKYLPQTRCRNARVRATAQAGSVVITWDDRLDYNANHAAAARALAAKLDWDGEWIGGFLPDASGCFVCNDARLADRFNIADPSPAVIAERIAAMRVRS